MYGQHICGNARSYLLCFLPPFLTVLFEMSTHHASNPPPSTIPSIILAVSPYPARPSSPYSSGCNIGTRRPFPGPHHYVLVSEVLEWERKGLSSYFIVPSVHRPELASAKLPALPLVISSRFPTMQQVGLLRDQTERRTNFEGQASSLWCQRRRPRLY